MNRLGVYDVDAAFDKMSLQTTDEFGLDAILERLVRAWRAEQARELLFLKRLVAKHRDRKRARAELTMMHRLFLLRDDHLFVRILGYCWFVDTARRMRHGAADAWTLLAERRGA